MSAIYNEIDPFAAQWMRNLIAEDNIAPGEVNERSITELTPADVAGPGQRHFFAGIGGWSYALRLAGIPDAADVWTGSCPCQPFSSAGKRSGTSDPRHLWPAWFALIRECRPPIIFGEQVASSDGLAWLDLVYADLERCGYAVGAADLCAAGVGAPHIRQRLYFVACADSTGRSELGLDRIREDGDAQSRGDTHGCGEDGKLGNASGPRSGRHPGAIPGPQAEGEGAWLVDRREHNESGDTGAVGTMADDAIQGRQPWWWAGEASDGRDEARIEPGRLRDASPWSDVQWIDCIDGKRRPIPTEPALFPLASGVPNRVGTLRGSGNAIVPQVAAAFIRAAQEARSMK